MSELADGLEWLNRPGASHLDEPLRQRLARITSPREETQWVLNEVERVIESSRQSQDPQVYPEVLAFCAVAMFNRRRINAARSYLQEAVRLYQGQPHRLAVARWMLGYVEWQMLETDTASNHWSKASEIFDTLAGWYQERAEQVRNEAKYSRAAGFREVFGWLNVFEASHLQPAGHDIVELIKQHLDESQQRGDMELNAPTVYMLMEKLQTDTEASEDYMETAEAYVECGFAAFRMRHYEEAIRCLRLAARHYHPYTHQQAVARWMLGIVEWEVETYRVEAQANWQQALDIMEELAINARHQNLLDRWDWYNDTTDTMKQALQEKLRLLSV